MDNDRYSETPRFRHDETELGYVYVRDFETDVLRSIFVRLVPAGVTEPADTLTFPLSDVEVDVAADGAIIGLTLHGFKNGLPEGQRAPVTVAQWLALEGEAAEREQELEALETAVLEAEAAADDVLDLERVGREQVALGLRIAAGIMGLEVGKAPAERDESKLLDNPRRWVQARRGPEATT